MMQMSPRVRMMRHDATAVTILVGCASSLAGMLIVHHNSEHSDHTAKLKWLAMDRLWVYKFYFCDQIYFKIGFSF